MKKVILFKDGDSFCGICFSILTVLVFTLTSCTGSKVISRGPFLNNAGIKSNSGLKYYVGRDIAKIDLEKKIITNSFVKTNLEIETTKKTVYSGRIFFHLIADQSKTFFLDFKPGSGTDDQLKIELSEKNLLKSIGITSIGRGGDVLKSAMNFTSVFATLPNINSLQNITYQNECKFDDSILIANDIRLLLKTSTEACQQYKSIVDLRDKLKTKNKTRLELENKIKNIKNEKELNFLTKKIQLVIDSITNLSSRLSANANKFQLLLKAFREKHKLGKKTKTIKYGRYFDISEIPSDIELPGLDHQNFKLMSEFKEKTNTIFTINPLSNSKETKKQNEEGQKKKKSLNIKLEKKNFGVFYRQKIPILLCLYKYVDGKPKKISEAIHYISHPNTPIDYFTFKSNTFSKRNLSIQFDKQGQPILVQRSSSSSLATLTSSISEGIVAARDQYVNTLKKITEAQELQRNIDMDSLITQSEKLKKENEILETQLSFDQISQNYEILLKQKQLDLEIKILDLEKKIEQSTNTRSLELKVNELKYTLELLTYEIKILKAQLELKQD